jgi:hypothetical protein
MSSANFTYDDVIQAARLQLNDKAQRRWPDADIMTYVLPRALQQLRSDRPDLFIGLFGSEVFKPSQSAPLQCDDAGFDALVEAVLAKVNEGEDEAANSGVSNMADARSQRDRKS